MAKVISKPKKEKIIKEKKVPATSLFDYLSWLTDNKRLWEELTREEQKGFNVFIVNRFFSMDFALCEAINEMQEFTMSMDKSLVWRIYHTILPQQKFFLRYIKATLKEGIEKEDIELFIKHFSCNEKQAVEYLELLIKKNLKSEIDTIKNFYVQHT